MLGKVVDQVLDEPLVLVVPLYMDQHGSDKRQSKGVPKTFYETDVTHLTTDTMRLYESGYVLCFIGVDVYGNKKLFKSLEEAKAFLRPVS